MEVRDIEGRFMLILITIRGKNYHCPKIFC